jgi:hypothetical protein
MGVALLLYRVFFLNSISASIAISSLSMMLDYINGAKEGKSRPGSSTKFPSKKSSVTLTAYRWFARPGNFPGRLAK